MKLSSYGFFKSIIALALTFRSLFHFELLFACRRPKRCGFDPWVGKIPWRRAWQPFPVFLLGESHGQRSLVSYSPGGLKGSDTTEPLTLPLLLLAYLSLGITSREHLLAVRVYTDPFS